MPIFLMCHTDEQIKHKRRRRDVQLHKHKCCLNEKYLCILSELHMIADAKGWKGIQLNLPCQLEVSWRCHRDSHNIQIAVSTVGKLKKKIL